jgi:hypothetical protein
MGWIKTGWIDAIGTELLKVIIGSLSSDSEDVSTYNEITIRASITFGGSSPKGNAIINVYNINTSSGGSDTPDTEPILSRIIKKELSSEVIITIPNIKTTTLDNLKIEIVNEDVNDNISVWISIMHSYAE